MRSRGVRVLDRQDRRRAGERRRRSRRADRREPAAPGAGQPCQAGDLRGDQSHPRVVVADEEREQAVVGAGQLAEPDGDRAGGKLGVGALPIGLGRGAAVRELVDVGQYVQGEQRPDHRDRAPDEAGDGRGADRAERVDGPQSGVDAAQQRRQRGLVDRTAEQRPGGDVGGDHAVGEVHHVAGARVERIRWAADGAGLAGRYLEHDRLR